MSFFGLRSPKELSDKKIIKFATKYSIPTQDVYRLDEDAFLSLLNSFDDSILRKDWYQPLQVKSFSSKGKSNAHLINCNMPDDWNAYESFDNFPMKMGDCRKVDTMITMKKEFSLIIPILGYSRGFEDLSASDEIIIVYWSHMMHSRSKVIIEEVEDYRTKNQDKKISVFYVNNDNFFAVVKK